MYAEDGNIVSIFLFNDVIARFGVPWAIVTDYGSHFHNQMMVKLSSKLGFRHEKSTPQYPQDNDQVESIKKVFKTMLRRMVGEHKSNWHLTLFSALWAYRISMKTTTSFTPSNWSMEWSSFYLSNAEVPSLKLVVEILPNTSTEKKSSII